MLLKFTINTKELRKAIGIVTGSIATRSVTPILSHILVSVDSDENQNQVRFTGTDREQAAQVWVRASNIVGGGSCTISAAIFSSLIATIDEENVTIEASEKPLQSKVYWGKNNSAVVKGLDPADYPLVPSLEEDEWGVSVSASLGNALARTIYAASTDDTRPAIKSVKFMTGNNQVTLAATDGYRLSVQKFRAEGCHSMIAVIPARAVKRVIEIIEFQDPKESVRICDQKEGEKMHFLIVANGEGGLQKIQYTASLFERTYPNYEVIIPKTHTAEFVVDRATLLRSLKTTRLFAKDDDQIARLYVRNGLMTIKSSSENGDNTVEVAAVGEGEIKIVANVMYLIQTVESLGGFQEITMQFTSETRPVVVKPSESADYNLHVLMPMHPPERKEAAK